MTRDELLDRLGELMIVGVPGTSLDAETEATLRRIRPSGAILFSENYADAAGAARLTRSLHSLLGTPELPALLTVDEEGGIVSRLSHFWDVPPPARAVSSSGGPPLVRDLAARTGRRLLALGFNLDFAPCLDIDSNPRNPVIGVRSFGENPSQVTACGRAAIEGFLSVGVIPVAKHFPGHGDTSLDSHIALPRVEAGERLLARRELLVVCRPLPLFALTSPVRMSASGTRWRRSDDFPTPEWPTRTVDDPIKCRFNSSIPNPVAALTRIASRGMQASATAWDASASVPRSALFNASRGTNPPRRASKDQRSTRPGRNGGSRNEATMRA